jgi:hypothetical protein
MDENPSIKSTKHVKINVNTRKENQGHQNSSNEMEDEMLKGILCNKSASDGGALVGMCGRDEKL